MPSGVSHGVAAAAACGAGVSAKATCAKFGMRLMRSSDLAAGDLDAKGGVGARERRQHIAALVNERLHAGRAQGGLPRAWPAGEEDVPRARRAESARGRGRFLVIYLVARAQADKRRAGGPAGGGEGRGLAPVGGIGADRFDPACGKEI